MDRWTSRNIDLKILSEHVAQFLEGKDFQSVAEEVSTSNFRITAVPNRVPSKSDIRGSVRILIFGEPNDFRVEFVGSSGSRPLERLGSLATLFGGGVFWLRDLKSSEELEKLEREFWKFMDETIDHLSDADQLIDLK